MVLRRHSGSNVQAGRAWARAGQPAQALDLDGLTIAGRAGLVSALAARITTELRELGLGTAAEAIAEGFEPVSAGYSSGSRPHTSAIRLPEKCPYCDGTVRADEVEWRSRSQALCDYCGSTLYGSEQPVG